MVKQREYNSLILYNEARLIKYEKLKELEREFLKKDFFLGIKEGFSKENSKIEYTNYLKYNFLPFAFANKMSSNDLNLLGVQKKELSLIFLGLYKIAQSIEDINPRQVQDVFIQSYISLQEISSDVEFDIKTFLNSGLLKKYQNDFFVEVLNDFKSRYEAFLGSYDIKYNPYFHFEYKSF